MKEEEDSFLRTLETGIRLLEKKVTELIHSDEKVFNGADAFVLYDTFGFPLDLTELILRESGMEVDLETFHTEMQKQKDRARNAAAIETGDWIIVREGETRFTGYDLCECETHILRYRKIIQQNKELYQIVLDNTPFYSEMGGQVGDGGWLISETGTTAVIDTKRENNLPVHLTKELPHDPAAPFIAKIDTQKRIQTECNHTATHLLHEALREILGRHVEQKGSYVSPDELRFDFSHFQKVTDEEIRKVEQLVNRRIRMNLPLEEHRSIPIAQAQEMGAMALFGEKYGDEVRVVRFGESLELCGGTHVRTTGQIGLVLIHSESSIAAGIRRIVAVSGERAEQLIYIQQDTIRELRALMNNVPNLKETIRKAVEENAELKKQIAAYMKEKSVLMKKSMLDAAIERNGVKLLLFQGEGNIDLMKDIAFQIKGEIHGKFCIIAGIEEKDNCALMVMLGDELVANGFSAARLVKESAKYIQGGGGGQPHFATAGGKNANGLSKAIDDVLEKLGLK
jgi:alanyl-tRNA synthetase